MSFNTFTCLSQLLLKDNTLIFLLVLNEIDIAAYLKLGCCVTHWLVT